MADPNFKSLNQDVLLALARDTTISNEQWAQFMQASYTDRKWYNEKLIAFQDFRFKTEITIKIVIPVILGIGLMLSGPAALLLAGATATLTLSSLIYSRLNLPEYLVEMSTFESLANFESDKWGQYRRQWIRETERHSLDDKQYALNINMTRIGIGLVISFATFASVVSGGSLPIIVNSALLAASLFFKHTDNPAPYIEEKSQWDALPSQVGMFKASAANQDTVDSAEQVQTQSNP